MVRTCLPGDGSIRSYLDKLELDGLARRHACHDKPIRIIGRQHRPNCSIPSRGPIAQLDSVPGKKDVVSNLSWRCIVDGERDWYELGRQYRVLYAVRSLRTRIGHSNVVVTIRDGRRSGDDLGGRPRVYSCGSGAELHRAGSGSEVFPGNRDFYAGLAARWTNGTDLW